MKHLAIFLIDKNDFFPLMLDNALGKQIDYRLMHYHTSEKAVKDLYMQPDIVVMGDSLSDPEKTEAVFKIKKAHPKAEIIIISSPTGDLQSMRDLFKEGVYDYIIKDKEILNNLSNSILNIHTLNTGIKKNRLFRKLGWV